MKYAIFAALIGTLLTSGCATTMAAGDAGCVSYGEARLTMPRETATLDAKWLRWIATMDSRMTGTCR